MLALTDIYVFKCSGSQAPPKVVNMLSYNIVLELRPRPPAAHLAVGAGQLEVSTDVEKQRPPSKNIRNHTHKLSLTKQTVAKSKV